MDFTRQEKLSHEITSILYKLVPAFYIWPPGRKTQRAIESKPWPAAGSTCPAKFRPGKSPAARGKGRESTRRAKATCGWSREGSGWPESGYPRWAGPAAGGARRRDDSGGRKREGPGREAAVGHGEAYGVVGLGRN
jgi:hypothetical protein